MKPIILINMKAYEQGMGENLTHFLEKLSLVEGREKARIILAVQPTDIFRVRGSAFECYAQHVDGAGFGSHTGKIHPVALTQAGTVGSLLNHAERQLSQEELESAVQAAINEQLELCICANTPERGAELTALNPLFIAVEPPELIGGDISVSKAQPEIITKSLALIREKNPDQAVLVGAGVKNGEDLKIALELGTQGVLLASGIVKHKDPAEVLADLVSVL